MGEPFQVMAAGCGGFVHHAGVAPADCEAEPTMVGLVMFRRADGRRAVWRAFACDRHADHLIAARPLLPRDRDVLRRRRDERRTKLAGRRWAGEQEGPLARGADADRLVERAKAWHRRHAGRDGQALHSRAQLAEFPPRESLDRATPATDRLGIRE